MRFFLLFLLAPITSASRAKSALQILHPRADYQGSWPLALTGSASTTCPVEASVQCSSTSVNPSCCPAGQTCIHSAGQDANYCCPTDADCNTSVLNFPRCANSTWVMYANLPAGFFCCETGFIGVNPSSSPPGGICEPSDQAIPTALLATVISQVGVTAAAAATGNSTMTGGGGAIATTTNVSPSCTSSGCPGVNGTAGTTGTHPSILSYAVGFGVLVALVFVGYLGSCVWRRTRRAADYEYQYDSDGNVIGNGVGGYRPGHYGQPAYGLVGSGGGGGPNNVTVNVVNER